MGRMNTTGTARRLDLKVEGGFSHESGMILWVRVGEAWEKWRFSRDGAEAEPAQPPKNSLFGLTSFLLGILPWRDLKPWARWTLVLLLTAIALYGLTVSGPKQALGLVMGFLGAGVGMRFTLMPRWHALEHKAVHLLSRLGDGPIPGREEVLKELRELPSLHPGCGVLFGSSVIALAALLTVFLPLTVALLLGVVLAEAAWRFGLDRIFLPIQHLFLAPPTEEMMERVAEELPGLLKRAEKG